MVVILTDDMTHESLQTVQWKTTATLISAALTGRPETKPSIRGSYVLVSICDRALASDAHGSPLASDVYGGHLLCKVHGGVETAVYEGLLHCNIGDFSGDF